MQTVFQKALELIMSGDRELCNILLVTAKMSLTSSLISLLIGVPVGFVNVVEGKEEILRACREYEVPAIVARGRKGGSTVAAAILNALLYEAAGMLAPESRGW